jgi:DNA-binding PucR family transcriptional regulator
VVEQLRYQIRYPELPLAVYREIAAHLRQVSGVEAGLIPQTSQSFDYHQSQIGGLWIEYTNASDTAGRERVNQILAYYQNRYGAWEDLVYREVL